MYWNLTGLLMGITSVLISNVFVIYYHASRKNPPHPDRIQHKEPEYDSLQEIKNHLLNPESFAMLIPYLTITWVFELLPSSYYSLTPSLNWCNVAYQLLVVDFYTYISHVLEHKISWLYKKSHKPHHKYINPHIFNAFSGSILDTTCLIIIPLYLTSQTLTHIGTLEYIVFGTIYSSYFMLIHSEYSHPWDKIFKTLGIGTSSDHNVHHILQKYNYGHFFTYWDRIFKTYRNPRQVKQIRR